MPTYFRTVHHFSFQAAGYLYSLSFLFAAIAIFVVAYFSRPDDAKGALFVQGAPSSAPS